MLYHYCWSVILIAAILGDILIAGTSLLRESTRLAARSSRWRMYQLVGPNIPRTTASASLLPGSTIPPLLLPLPLSNPYTDTRSGKYSNNSILHSCTELPLWTTVALFRQLLQTFHRDLQSLILVWGLHCTARRWSDTKTWTGALARPERPDVVDLTKPQLLKSFQY